MKQTENPLPLTRGLKKIKKKLFKQTKRKPSFKAEVENFQAHAAKWEDQTYVEIFLNGLMLDGTSILGRDRRFWQMAQFFKSVQHLEGHTAEAGCRFGLSSYILCHYELRRDGSYDGASHHLFDSFKGLSPPVDSDLTGRGKENQIIMKLSAGYQEPEDDFLERTQTTLQDFPRINYYKGWIPEVFATAGKRNYKFVHIDLDLYEPIYHSLQYFYPQVVSGGCIVIDDYGFPTWPGAKRATDQWADENGCHVIPLLSKNAVIFKP